MWLTSLELENFRNYSKRSFNFFQGTTLIVGGNGMGKTNILEACFLLATGKSFRAQRVEEMIMYEKELARVKGIVSSEAQQEPGVVQSDKSVRFDEIHKTHSPLERNADSVSIFTDSNSSEQELEILLNHGELQGKRVAKRRYQVDGSFKRLSNFVGQLVAVLFRPEDLQLILGSPSARRGFLDEVLMQIDREYRRSLVSYEKALTRRNKLLDAIRDEGASRTQLAFWDQLLIKHGQVITSKRSEFIDFIKGFKERLNSFDIQYNSSVISEIRLEQYKDKEVAAGYTLVGPHKDDFLVSFEEEKALSLFGSRGEQRLAVLWLKLAELAYVSEILGEQPLLLLDDIFSELDEEHRRMVLSVIPRQQTLITTTDPQVLEGESGIDVLELGF